MGSTSRKGKSKKGKKVRVAFRRNRAKPPRHKDWTRLAKDAEGHELDAHDVEQLVAKGDLSRRRTIVVHEGGDIPPDLMRGTVVAMRGLYAEVDDGERMLPCTVSRVLRTRLIDERNPVTVGDSVGFRLGSRDGHTAQEGVIDFVAPRHGELCRRSGRRNQTIVANVDQAIIVASAAQPAPKPHLIDRYIVAALAGGITTVICMNKV
ncbi:MAG: GTPase RsgA, partial [Planctomycetes bacterium]|nr:GTPase RsgA [Planctomycetota bacterium]